MLGSSCHPCCGPTCTPEQFQQMVSAIMSAPLSINIQHSLPTQDAATFFHAQQNCTNPALWGQRCESPQQFWLPPTIYLQQQQLPNTLELALDVAESYVYSDTAALRYTYEYIDNDGRVQYDASAEIWMSRGNIGGYWFPGTRCEIRIGGVIQTYCYIESQVGPRPVPSVSNYYQQFENEPTQRRMVVVNAPFYKRGFPSLGFADALLPDTGIAGSDQWTSFFAAYDEQVATVENPVQVLSHRVSLSNAVNTLTSYSADRMVVSVAVSSIDPGPRPTGYQGGPPMQKWQDLPTQGSLPTWVTNLQAGALTYRGYFLAEYDTAFRAYQPGPSPSVSSVEVVLDFV